jgi:hypothetical protein
MRTRNSCVRAVVALAFFTVLGSSASVIAVPFNVGDVFAGIGNGRYNHFSPTGTLLETLDSGQGGFNTTGMCFDPAGNLYGTNFSANSMSKFTNNGTLVGLFGSFNSNPESCLIIGGTVMYTSEVGGTGDILKFNLSGTQLANYNVARSDWIDLASDQCTMLYTDEGSVIRRFNVCTNTALSDFVNLPGSNFYALRILPNGDVLVASAGSVRRFNSAGTEITPAYTASGETFFFALNLDPDGTHFWSGGISTGIIYKFSLTPVGPPVLSFSSQLGTTGGAQLAGVAVFGEVTAGQPTPTPTVSGPIATPTATLTPTLAGAAAVVPTLSFPMLALLGVALAAGALLAIRRL